MCERSTDRASVDQAVVEASHSAEHLLAVGVQLLQLVLDQHGVQRGALLDQVLSKHDQGVDLVGVQGDFLLEALRRAAWGQGDVSVTEGLAGFSI